MIDNHVSFNQNEHLLSSECKLYSYAYELIQSSLKKIIAGHKYSRESVVVDSWPATMKSMKANKAGFPIAPEDNGIIINLVGKPFCFSLHENGRYLYPVFFHIFYLTVYLNFRGDLKLC